MRTYYLQQMGIECWETRAPHVQQTASETTAMTMTYRVVCFVQDHVLDARVLRFLYTMLSSIGVSQEQVYMAVNTDKLSLTTMNADVILVLGETSGQFILDKTDTLDKLRAKTHDYHGTPLLVSYHPADLLQTPLHKKNMYRDLLWVSAQF
jgi:DNA polymerase III psi subunit